MNALLYVQWLYTHRYSPQMQTMHKEDRNPGREKVRMQQNVSQWLLCCGFKVRQGGPLSSISQFALGPSRPKENMFS